jgi:ArsR family transcriptional regulator, arsenate/arsenite/antimonite-responsive transcriptional repressor
MKRATDPDVLLLQATADPTRLAILRQLSEDGGVCACDFTVCCDVGQPTISHHLKVLRDAGWVTTERHGTWIWYSLCPDAVARFREIAGDIRPGAPKPAAMLGLGGSAAAAAGPSPASDTSAGCRPPRVELVAPPVADA